MRRSVRGLSSGARAALGVLAVFTLVTTGRADDANDPLSRELARWSAYLKDNTSTDEFWTQVKQSVTPAIAKADEDLRAGRRLLALLRLATIRPNLAGSMYQGERTEEQRKDPAQFEAEWARMGTVLQADLSAPSPSALEGVRPAAVRAIGEAALPQVRVFYDSSLEYGRSTTLQFGLFYIGAAQSQRDFAAFCRALSAPTPLKPPPVRSLGAELDALQSEMLAAYRPPASIEKHGEFINASSTLKEARELDAAGLRYGALLKYLQAAYRFAPLSAKPPSLPADALAARLEELAQRVSSGPVDHSIGRLLVEVAQADVASAAPGKEAATAAAIAVDVLPRYFAALEPARKAAPRPAPEVTVTLVRWPYT